MTEYITPLFSYGRFMLMLQESLGGVPATDIPGVAERITVERLDKMLLELFHDGQIVKIPEAFCNTGGDAPGLSISFTHDFELEVMDSQRPKLTELQITARWKSDQ